MMTESRGMSGDERRPQFLASLAGVFSGSPLAQKVFVAGTTAFALFNFGSWIAAINSLAVYADWLEASQPFTDAVARIVPAVDSAPVYLENHAPDMIPAVRNILAINFALLLFFPWPFAVATCVDLLRNPERASGNMEAVATVFYAPSNQVIWRGTVMFLALFVPFYFNLLGVARPWLLGITTTMADYVVLFGVIALYLLMLIFCVISRVSLALRAAR
jgi:hypothetical protein